MLLVAVNALVGGTLGHERTVLPLTASQTFKLDLYTSALTYILAFGLSKAAITYFAGTLSDRYGRKPVLIAGWLIATPVPLMLIFGVAASGGEGLSTSGGTVARGWVVAQNVRKRGCGQCPHPALWIRLYRHRTGPDWDVFEGVSDFQGSGWSDSTR
jgi:MFS family permease